VPVEIVEWVIRGRNDGMWNNEWERDLTKDPSYEDRRELNGRKRR
jgi:hypothetical protein